ncbi:ferritin-like domain-containing protein [Alteribacter keqinensis]|uniref:Ferritin-like domain-containing protein n=1 Tax=Alteribacter keqinensis TaxID=2483800 RepID=A0A3M7TSW1_9BACI|nr:ferritin-like domain-containing protein [Alteribacter keqinensis]RNA68597.1 ferritin-like domain-containing protein [Alteribacter keqinensis]
MYNSTLQLTEGINPEQINNIARAMNVEYTSIFCLETLAQLAPSLEERERILAIRADEFRHYRMFAELYFNLTGREHTPQMIAVCSNLYERGLKEAFFNKQNNVAEYLNAAEQADVPAVRNSFRRASWDEQNHGVWLLYLLTNR